MEIEKPPKYLYKYRGWNEHTRAMIEKGELFYQDHSKQNDPFEIKTRSEMPTDRFSREKLARRELSRFSLPQKIPDEHFEKFVSQMVAAMDNPVGLLSPVEPYGIFCMTELPDNLLMWAHYGLNHSGVCVQFDAESWEDEQYGRLTRIEYKSEIPVITANDWLDDTTEEPFHRTTRTKSKDWEYEKEWRAICHTPSTIAIAKKRMIPAIIVGACCPDDHRQEIKEVCDSRGIKVYEAKLSETKYAIEIPGLNDSDDNS
ncbi:DUF2971 domain-containing protein [bacterium]|nr:DUF2971 domain-containing protein [bacterium]